MARPKKQKSKYGPGRPVKNSDGIMRRLKLGAEYPRKIHDLFNAEANKDIQTLRVTFTKKETDLLESENLDSGTKDDDKYYMDITVASPVDLDPGIQAQAQKQSGIAFRRNPRAWNMIELVKDFVIGDGFKVVAKDKRTQSVLDLFYEANGWKGNLTEERVRSLALNGSQLYGVEIAKSGLVFIFPVLPESIVRAKRNDKNMEKTDYVTFQYKDGTEIKLMKYNVLNREVGEKNSKHLTLFRWNNEVENPCFYFPANRVSGGSRGVPDMTPVLDWLEGMDQFVFSVMERADAASSIVFDVEYRGLGPEELRKKITEIAEQLQSGGIYAHNEGATLTIKTPTFGAFEADKVSSMIMKQIFSGGRLAGLYYGDSDDLTRASASELSVPVAKMLQGKQRFFGNMLLDMGRFQVYCSKEAGALEPDANEDFTIELARIYLRDISGITKPLLDLGTSLTNAQANQWVTQAEAAKVYRNAIKELGTELPEFDSATINPDKTVEDLYNAAKQSDKAKLQESYYVLSEGFDPDQPRDDHGRWSSTGGGDLEATTSKGAKVRVSGDSVFLTPIGKSEQEIDVSDIGPVDPGTAAQLKSKGIDTTNAVQLKKGTPYIFSGSDAAIVKDAQSRIQKAKADFEREYPGISAIRDAESKYEASRFAYERAHNQERISGYPIDESPALRLKYPKAAKYLQADSFSMSKNDVKADIGRRAKQRIKKGHDVDVVIKDMHDEWSKYSLGHID